MAPLHSWAPGDRVYLVDQARVGHVVQWRGQDGVYTGLIIAVSEPQPGNYVLTVKSGSSEFAINYRQVMPVTAETCQCDRCDIVRAYDAKNGK